MGKDKLEFFVKNKLDSYESPVDSNELWANIQSSVGGSAAVTTTAWYVTYWKLLLGIGCVMSIAAYFYLVNMADNQLADESISDKSETIQIPNTNQSATKGAGIDYTASNEGLIETKEIETVITNEQAVESKNGDSKVNAEANNSSNISTDAKSAISDQVQPSISIENSVANANLKTDLKSKNKSKSESSISSKQENKAKTAQDVVLTSEDKQPASAQISNVQESTLANNADKAFIQTNETDILNKQGAATSKESVNTIEDNQKTALREPLISYANHNFLMAQEFGFNANQTSLITTEIPVAKLSELPSVDCPTFKKKKSWLSLDIHAIPYYSIKNLIASDSMGANWAEQRNSTEYYLESFQVNALLKYRFANGLYLQGGVGYGQIDEKLEVPQTTTETSGTEQGPIIIIIYGNGQPNDTIQGEIGTNTIETKYTKTYNYHRMVEIPLAIGYEMSFNRKWAMYVDMGASFNIYTNRTGYIQRDNERISFNDPQNPIFNTSTGLKLNGSLGAKYYLKDGLSLSVGPDIRYHVNNWLISELPLEQRYLDLGLRIGLSIPLK